MLLTYVVLVALSAFDSAAQSLRRSQNEEIITQRLMIRRNAITYQNYAINNFTNYANHTFPFDDTPRAIYGPLGDFLLNGYDLYSWKETRVPGQDYGSSIFKPNEMFDLAWNKVYDGLVMGRDGYDEWSYSLIVADNLTAHLSPLTLSKTDFNGVRLDVGTHYVKFTGLASRIERPHNYQEVPARWALEKTHFADDSTMLLGSRVQADLGRLQFGLNWANMHVYQSTQPGNSLKGRLRPDQPLIDWIVVRFADDSPTDGASGATVQAVQLIVNGAPRPDLTPHVVRHRSGIVTQVGRVSQATGEFQGVNYRATGGHIRFYRGRNDMPLYADYLYRLDHEAGFDVSKNTNLEGLLKNIELEEATSVLHADGDQQLIFLFDLSSEPHVESVEVEAILGNDYRVDVALLNNRSPRAHTYYSQYLSTFYRAVLRAAGNIQDLSNLKRLRFSVEEHTGIFTYSVDARFALPGLDVNVEYARSAVYGRYPSHLGGERRFDSSPRGVERGEAYFVNATHWFRGGRVGGELFAITPDFQTDIRTFLDYEIALDNGPLTGMTNQTVYWELVQDNDDGDRFPDRRIGNVVGFSNDSHDGDADGVLLGEDDDHDGWPETDRNGNGRPDYDEPFLLYEVEPDEYVYGLDRNHNEEPDRREDDEKADYPYDYDQHGFHLFGQWDLGRRLSLSAGRYDTREFTGNRRNRSTYAMLTYRWEEAVRLQRFFLESVFQRVQDDIEDGFVARRATPNWLGFSYRGLVTRNRGFSYARRVSGTLQIDPLLYQDSYVNETYLEVRLNPKSTFNLVQKLRLRFNWQQRGRLYNGSFQRQRRLEWWTSVSRVDHTWLWGRLMITPQFKFLLLRFVDRAADRRLGGGYAGRVLRYETQSIPILRLECPLMEKTRLRVGIQGIGPLPYRGWDHLRETASFEQRTLFATLTNRSRYFGYDMLTIIGIEKDEKMFDRPSSGNTVSKDSEDHEIRYQQQLFQRAGEVHLWSLFVRVLIGFTEYGRPF